MKLRDIYNRVRALLEAGESQFVVGDFLEGAGAEYLDSGEFSRAYVMVFPWGSVVIKFAANRYGSGVNALTREDGKRWPLLWRRYVKPLFASREVIVQPLVDVSTNTARASLILRRWFRKLYQTDFDAHSGNVGHYRGRAMIFDPLTPAEREIMEDYSGNSYYSIFDDETGSY